ncbi:hypothetical protein LEN26_015078 [Aphanomyces euteiches]|nr:hypothetical protein LEN26_015078 [Aphanomyces euteiches]KAH9106631.1 hypothetical protein AeMF1_017771 [Aphanomyces euteiches]KAH9187913.1 hypothetical protein AeNC1_010116 [Aphanomyces euteiches]
MTLSHEQFSEEDDVEEEVVLTVKESRRPSKISIPEPSDKAPNLYADSPRSCRTPPSLSKAEEKRRKAIGCGSLVALLLMVVVCIAMVRILSGSEHLNALTPNQKNFMLATKAAGAKETLAYYTRESRWAGSQGDYAMAQYIVDKARDFGFPEDNVKISDYELFLNEPISLRVGVVKEKADGGTSDLVFDLSASTDKSKPVPYHFYSKNGTARGPLVYAHYGRTEDFIALRTAGVNLTNAILLVRLGRISLPAKIELAKTVGAVAVLTYSDPADNGSLKGKQWPNGPYQPNDRAAFGSVYMGNGDPSTPDDVSVPGIERYSVDMIYSEDNTRNYVPQVVSVPISADVAASLLANVQAGPTANQVFGRFVGGVDAPYNCGPSAATFFVDNLNKYTVKKTWNVVISLEGTREADRIVLVGSQRDSAISGATSPGSGNAVFIELLRGIGTLLGQGWAPHRTIFLASIDAEDYGNVGTAEWIDKHASNFASRAVVFLNIRDPVLGPGPLSVEASSSLRTMLYLTTLGVGNPDVSAKSTDASTALVMDSALATQANLSMVWEDLTNAVSDSVYYYWLKQTKTTMPKAVVPEVLLPGSTHVISPFVSRLGVPVVELGFDSGIATAVEDTTYDTLEWMKSFGDPSFTFHRAAAQLYGSALLTFSDAVFLPYDFAEYAKDLRKGKDQLVAALKTLPSFPLNLDRLEKAIMTFEKAAYHANNEIRLMQDEMLDVLNGQMVVDVKRARDMNNRLMMTERAFLFPEGLPGKPWLKHAIYGHSVWNDYNITLFPGVFNALSDISLIDAKHQLHRLCRAIEDASDALATVALT